MQNGRLDYTTKTGGVALLFSSVSIGSLPQVAELLDDATTTVAVTTLPDNRK